MNEIDFYDLMTVDPLLWGKEIDPIGLLTYQNYKRKRAMHEAVDFLRSNDVLISISYDVPKKQLKLVKRNYEKWPIFINMSPEAYKDFSSSENKPRWINQKIKASKIEKEDGNTYRLVEEAEELDEVLTLQQRMRRKILMRRLAPRIARARKIAMRRRGGTDVLKRRANALARRTLAKKLLGGRNKSDVSTSERARIEKILAKRKKGIERLATRLLPKVRAAQSKRFAAKKTEPAKKPAPQPAASDNK